MSDNENGRYLNLLEVKLAAAQGRKLNPCTGDCAHRDEPITPLKCIPLGGLSHNPETGKAICLIKRMPITLSEK